MCILGDGFGSEWCVFNQLLISKSTMRLITISMGFLIRCTVFISHLGVCSPKAAFQIVSETGVLINLGKDAWILDPEPVELGLGSSVRFLCSALFACVIITSSSNCSFPCNHIKVHLIPHSSNIGFSYDWYYSGLSCSKADACNSSAQQYDSDKPVTST